MREKEINGKIYLIYNNFDKNRYVGQTINSVEERFKAHKQGTRQPKKNMSKLQLAMEHHGKKNFFIRVLAENIPDAEKLAQCERFYIKVLGTENEYNSSKGGESPLSKIMNEKINKDLIRIHKDFNKLSFPNLNKKELDFLYGLIFFLSTDQRKSAHVSFSKLLKMSDIGNLNKTELGFGSWLNIFIKKINRSTLIDKENKSVMVTLFDYISVDFVNKYIDFALSDSFLYLISNKKKNNTSFSFSRFKSFNTKYEKLLFRHLSEHKSAGAVKFNIDEFTRLMDTPSGYNTSKVRQVAIDPTIKTLNDLFPDLNCETIRECNKAVGYKFTWSI